ncbi:hypothetical protein HWV62_28250 [Athelia sp. TMB]|nr:hypothetical protein HWV62_28250 [Athelia sp. TMB]
MQQPETDEAHLTRQTPDPTTGPSIPFPSSVHITPHDPQNSPTNRLTIRLPRMTVPSGALRRSSRRTASLGTEHSLPSGSEYNESERSMEVDQDADAEGEDEVPSPKVEYTLTARGRKVPKRVYRESDEDGESIHDAENDAAPEIGDLFSVKAEKYEGEGDDEEEDEDDQPRRLRRRNPAKLNGFIVSDEEPASGSRYPTRNRSKKTTPPQPKPPPIDPKEKQKADRLARIAKRTAAQEQNDPGYVDEPISPSSHEGDFDDAPRTSSDLDGEGEVDVDVEGEADAGDAEQEGRPYALRKRAQINYAIPPPLEDLKAPPKPSGSRGRNAGGKSGGARPNGKRGPGWSATGAELGKWMGMPGDDSDSDYNTRTPRKTFAGAFAGGAAAAGGAGGMLSGDLAAAGTPSNMGKIGDSALADADPLGVNTNVTFDEVGGLDDHIHSLKEMTLLPLLYPEVFQRFNVTPPRGVLFHGPPGTGKTLLARALAASCRKDGRQISFFMRKGADCLSKWVGEAERQLRLLFEEARNSQPSIIFFDEIDGLAPVRSSKQDQIHASIVSTLLALMDGMDGRGQVVVIGATNRPDAVDPALRRPGRFDREFYFGLPSLQAREKILGIMTKGWDGWGQDKGSENVKGLARLTKGYGGADLRALCTEAALNAVQRRYPQIYKSDERLLLNPQSIEVGLRDFMISIKKLVPSSARSTSSSATPLPQQFLPLLLNNFEQVKQVISKVLPITKKLTALEEAEWEEDSEEGALEREMTNQAMETLRVYRPRVILHGPVGMGQNYVGPAALHHLEGYHVQSLELGTLMSDSTRTVEAAIVQLFVEAKRHQPSIIYIPSLVGWCAAVSETSRSTVRAMLDTLAPTDPILLLAIVDGPFTALPRDVRAWFGPTRDNRVAFTNPSASQREDFFDGLLKDVQRRPNEFADGVQRKRRVLEELPVAPPVEPRQPTTAELAVQEEADQRVITLLKYRLGPILTELKRKFKRFTKRAREEYDFEAFENAWAEVETVTTTTIEVQSDKNGVIEIVDEERMVEEGSNILANGIDGEPRPQHQHQQQAQAAIPRPPAPVLFDMDLEHMHVDLYKGKYLTPQEFLEDVEKIVHNSGVMMNEDLDRLYKAQAMLTAAQVSIHDFDPGLRLECERMATRERRRREEHRKQKDKEKGKAEEPTQLTGTRRSARHNGQQPELMITDPAQLERKLKRQRSNEGGAQSHDSSEEHNDERETKRSKMSVSDDDERDHLNTVGSDPLHRLPTVRFAADLPAQPLENAGHFMNGLNTHGQDMPPSPSPMKTAGFDPSLLNPVQDLSSMPSYFNNGPPLPSLLQNFAATSAFTPNEMFLPLPTAENQTHIHTPIPQTPTPHSPAPHTPSRNEVALLSPIIQPEAQPEPTPTPMVIERTPTPLPDFHVDQDLVYSLKAELRDSTGFLNVEQLEQLRATCLGCVWRHRTEWNRDTLVREMMAIVKEFVNEVNEDMEHSSP